MRRTQSGSAVAELPAVLWALFCLLVFPILDLTAVGIRIGMVSYMAQRSCTLAARANSFETPLRGALPAIDAAHAECLSLASKMGGVHFDGSTTQILATSVNNKQTTTFNHALPTPADTSDYTYQINVSVTAHVDPLVTLPYLPVKVSGLTGPISITCSDRQFAECPNGLNI